MKSCHPAKNHMYTIIRADCSRGPGRVYAGNQGCRAAYDVLMPAEKKTVTLYKELQNYEKRVKSIQAAIEAIPNVQFDGNLVSSYDKGVG